MQCTVYYTTNEACLLLGQLSSFETYILKLIMLLMFCEWFEIL